MEREKEGTICSCVTQVRTVPLIAGKKSGIRPGIR